METAEFAFPIPRTHCGVPMGNGSLGALVWGKDRLCITVNRADFWDHRGGKQLIEGTTYEKLKEVHDPADREKMDSSFGLGQPTADTLKPTRLPMGRFEMELAEGFRLGKAIVEYDRGRVWIELVGKGKKPKQLMLSLGSSDDILYLEDKDGSVSRVHVRPAWEWVGEQLKKRGFSPPMTIRETDKTGWVQECPADDAMAAVCGRVESGLAICLSLGADAKTAISAAESEIVRFATDGADSFLARTDASWQEYWRGVPEVRIPSADLGKLMTHSLYRFHCATDPHGCRPAGLQGPWIEEYQLPLGCGDYHFNVNIQQIYSPAFAAGSFDHLIPLFDMLETDSFQKVMRHNARVLFGIDDGLALMHAVDDRGYLCAGRCCAGATIDFAVGAWTAQLYWLYYQYTLDETFLRERAYPFMFGVMRVYEEAIEEYKGRLSIPISISAEYGCTFRLPDGGLAQNVGRDPSYQLAAAHMLVDALTKASETLGVPPTPAWKSISQNLPRYATIKGHCHATSSDDFLGGQERIAVWEGQDLEICHRHHSHLACIYPFESLPEVTPEVQRVIDNSVDHWIARGMGEWASWSFPWAVSLLARLGLAEACGALLALWQDVFVNEGLAVVYIPRFRGISTHRGRDVAEPKETTEIIQLDGAMAGVTALYEMLVHARGETIHVFPAVPAKWRDVSFTNIRVPGAFSISAERKQGRTESVRIHSLKGGPIHVTVSDLEVMQLRTSEGVETVTLPATLDLSADEAATMKAIT